MTHAFFIIPVNLAQGVASTQVIYARMSAQARRAIQAKWYSGYTSMNCTVAKLIEEGCTGYLIRLSKDDAAGRALGYVVAQNEIDNQNRAKALGCKKAFSFYCRNHRMHDVAMISNPGTVDFLFRLLQANTASAWLHIITMTKSRIPLSSVKP